MSNTLSTRSLKFESLDSDLRVLTRTEVPANPEANVSAWVEIDGWEDTTHGVKFFWRTEDGESMFALHLIPRSKSKKEAVDISYDEMQAVRHERHTYPFVAPKLGHDATVLAMGIPKAA